MFFFLFKIGVNPAQYELYSLPAKKWHWRARTSALFFSQTIPLDHQYRFILTSSVLNLAELLGVRPDLAKCKKIVYFHENQLVYPVREIKERDCQYGMNQIMTWFVIFFNLITNLNFFCYFLVYQLMKYYSIQILTRHRFLTV